MAARALKEETIFRMGAVLAVVTAALSIVGAFIMWAPTLLLSIGLLISLWEVFAQSQRRAWSGLRSSLVSGIVVLVFVWLFYITWFVFVVHIQVKFAGGFPVNDDGVSRMELRIATKVTNIGRPTTLGPWKAYISVPGEKDIWGEIRAMPGDSIELSGREKVPKKFALPDCDLSFETTRAVQTGDSVYGIVTFWFPFATLPDNAKFTIQAEDMLGRTVEDRAISIDEINHKPAEVFPCRVKP